ncbi:DUF2269 domain-containing protein [Allosphingosinicella flava]|uniref:DUF2269 domain-containing protein n=1 Tax=Allosphingosinicella flava TaxID=2771430 RepID=A0A7T2GJV5_9SPHN|nr:DUF2269 domain-containing protein [Sphingosinicella flava]QPQ55176.1 DUF2269 domain-containing protein [Sphingosinicella flava]
MSDYYLLLKWVHILSSTILFGFGAGTAWYLWAAHRTGDPRIIASVAQIVVKADWIFTGTSGVVQPVSGVLLASASGYALNEGWLLLTYALYLLAFTCWAPVVALQIRARRLAEEAAREGTALDERYQRTMRLWFLLGWPAFLSLIAVYWLMVAKPAL